MTQPTVNYIIAAYLGERRMKTVSSPDVFIPRHLDYLQEHKVPVSRVTVVLSYDYNSDQLLRAKKIMDQYKDYYTDLKLMIKDNAGLSYGAWGFAIDQCYAMEEYFDYFFLIEDDYAPGSPDFLDRFMTKMVDPEVGYVCHKLSHVTLSKIFGTQVHAGMSSGLLRGQAAFKTWLIHGSVFLDVPTDGYDWGSVMSQVHFLDYITEIGYALVDASDMYSAPFVHGDVDPENKRGFFLMEYGTPGLPRALEPIVDWKMFK